MTSRYSARIGVAAGARTPAVLAAVEADARFYSESGREAQVRVSAGDGDGDGSGDGDGGGEDGARQAPSAATVRIGIDAGELPHLRAGVSSTLRLVQAAYESIGAAAAAASAPEEEEAAAGASRAGGGPAPAPQSRGRRRHRRGAAPAGGQAAPSGGRDI